MIVIDAFSANDALRMGLRLIGKTGEPIESRAGKTIEVPDAVATTYHSPEKRVLISKVRDANPFFHLMEALWILNGRDDTKFLCEFNSNMINYSDDGVKFNAPYGDRLKYGFIDSKGEFIDQIQSIIDILKRDPNSRQAIAQIWDPKDLNNFETKDKACNMQAVFRVRKGKLCLTIYNRSNDIIWGAYGANIVQFSMLLEYVAAKVGIPMGTYTQVSNSYHVYTEGPGGLLYNRLIAKYDYVSEPYDYVNNQVLMKRCQMDNFDSDLNYFFSVYDANNIETLAKMNNWQSDYFKELVIPMLRVYDVYKRDSPEAARAICHEIEADDWRKAAQDWMEVRIQNRKRKENK